MLALSLDRVPQFVIHDFARQLGFAELLRVAQRGFPLRVRHFMRGRLGKYQKIQVNNTVTDQSEPPAQDGKNN